ncbi:reverse transcriptase domain-containing protein, partial [Nephila pilipes]
KTDEYEEPTIYSLEIYDTSCTSYLTVRTLNQLDLDEFSKYLLASNILLRDVYLDDVESGAQNLESVKEFQSQLIHMLAFGVMSFYKWYTNSEKLMDHALLYDPSEFFTLDMHTAEKSLGVNWEPMEDKFIFLL